ncbi:MAG: carboxypeptidase regulatory-like domain-containing protein, partial [Gemmatimonadales bacterium]
MGALALGVLLLQATVAGAVRDATSGQPVAHAVLSLTDLNRVSRASPGGRYELRLVPAGPQHLAVRALGYRPRTLHALVPRAGTLEIDVVLEPDPQHLPPIVVNPEERLPVRGLERDQGLVRADRSLGAAAIRNHPLLAEPDAFRALSGGDVVMSPETPSGIHVRGGAADHTGYVLDGIPILNPYHSAGIFGAWNPDALERIELWSTLPSLGHGAALAGVVEGITRAPGRRLGASG